MNHPKSTTSPHSPTNPLVGLINRTKRAWKEYMDTKRINNLAASLQAAKDRQRKVHEDLQAIGAQVQAARLGEAAESAHIAALQRLLQVDPGGARDTLREAHQKLQAHREDLAALEPVQEAASARYHERSTEALRDLQTSLQALLEGIRDKATDNLDGETVHQLKRGYAALLIGGFFPPWPDYLASVLPRPDNAQLEALKTEITEAFPVLTR